MKQRLKVEVQGIVQGVGFRPYIYRLAHRLHLTGRIHNSEAGVSIEIQGIPENLVAFMNALPAEAPPLAQLHRIESLELSVKDESEFLIVESTRSHRASTLISPDIATCDECVRELFNPVNRRYRYPFLNCTNCGPRFTITRSIPYDRKQTSMAAFPLCALCQAEYDDPLNRRFHAQPNACWECGPQVHLVDRTGVEQTGDPILHAIKLLRQGRTLAIKGLGGFHLAVDAHQPTAVAELRRRKGRRAKPFAVMVRDFAAANCLCQISEEEATSLESPQRPIVLLRKRDASLDALAPDADRLGIILPYTPLHHLLLSDKDLPALVMTSGNLSEEPIAIDNDEALARLCNIADYFLLHNRDILLRCDDSVVKHVSGKPQFARRSRGFVPTPIQLKASIPTILAVGGELKNAICLSRDRYAFLGQHIGDLENLTAYEFFQESIQHFQNILEVTPQVIAYDLHPGYLATRWALERRDRGIPAIGVQHHHAHIASCMAEHQLTGPVIGIALDGTGYGTDGCAWGGEVLIASLSGFERAAHLAYVPMPGGEQAIHEPWRMAASYLWQTFGQTWKDHAPASMLAKVPTQAIRIVEQLLGNSGRLAQTSSCGRLFDAVAALVLNRTQVTYEAQAAIALEACCDPNPKHGAYPFAILESDVASGCLQVDARPLFGALTEDLRRGVPPGILSSRFHTGLVNVLTETATRVAERSSLRDVCLSGGSFQNAILSQRLEEKLAGAGLIVHRHTLVPPGDGGLSLGQLVVAANTPLAPFTARHNFEIP